MASHHRHDDAHDAHHASHHHDPHSAAHHEPHAAHHEVHHVAGHSLSSGWFPVLEQQEGPSSPPPSPPSSVHRGSFDGGAERSLHVRLHGAPDVDDSDDGSLALPLGSPFALSSDGEEVEEGDDVLASLATPPRGGGVVDDEDSHAASELHRPLPFEFRVLDAALESVCGRLEAEVTELEAAAAPALDALVTSVSAAHVDRLKRVRGALARLAARVNAARSEVQRLLDDDSDMRDMHLTRKAAAREQLAAAWLGVRHQGAEAEAAEAVRAAAHEAVLAENVDEDDDLQELEDLLETYFAQLDSCSNRLSVLRQVITDTEEYVNVGLDSKRNKILEFNICVGFAVLCHSIASSLYGVFGMNFILCDGAPCDAIPSPFKRSGTWTFKLVSILVAVLAVLLWCAIMFTLRWLGYLHILPGGRRRQPTAHLLEKEERLEVTYEKSFKEFAQQGAGAR